MSLETQNYVPNNPPQSPFIKGGLPILFPPLAKEGYGGFSLFSLPRMQFIRILPDNVQCKNERVLWIQIFQNVLHKEYRH